MRKPKVSVLIPAYNHEKFLRETIESVLNQTFPDFELLISDDCSTDHTAQVIKSFSDERITGIFFEENRGTVRALNHLLRISQGEYIAVLGSDDVWESDKLEKQVEKLEGDPSVAACFSWATIIDQNSDVIDSETVFPIHIFNQKQDDKAFIMREFFLSGNHFCHSSALIRRDVHQRIGEYNLAYRQLHDFDLWIRLLIDYNIHIIEKPLVKYRYVQNSGNMSQSTEWNNFRMYNEGEEIIYFLFKNIKDEDFIKAFSQAFICKHATTNAHLACEKFFILRDKNLWGIHNSSLAIRFLLEHLNETMLLCFEREYGISLNELYDYTKSFKAAYHANLFVELTDMKNEQIKLQKQIEEIYASTSWKLTKPLRAITGRLIKDKRD